MYDKIHYNKKKIIIKKKEKKKKRSLTRKIKKEKKKMQIAEIFKYLLIKEAFTYLKKKKLAEIGTGG